MTERIALRATRTARRSRLRTSVTIATVASSLLVLVFAVEAFGSLGHSFLRATFPYADVQPFEGIIMLAVERMAGGQAAYLSTLDANSYTFGPVYLYLLGGLHALSRGPVDVASARMLTMVLGIMGTLPLVFSAMAIAARASTRTSVGVTNAIAGTVAATLGVAVLSRAMTFDAIHPDDLLFTLSAAILALYYAAGREGDNSRLVWALAALGVVVSFTELQASAIAPVMLFCLAVTRRIEVRVFISALATYACALLFFLAVMGGDARAWTFLVPLAQPYDFTADGFAQFALLVTHWHPYLGVLIASVPATMALIWRREGARTLWVDLLPLLVIVATAWAGYFHRLGFKNSLFLIGIVCVPYFAGMIGALATPRALARRDRAGLSIATFGAVLAVAMVFTLRVPPKQVAASETYAVMAGAQSAANHLCGLGKPIVVMTLPDLFFPCTTATYALALSFQQLTAAFPGYYVGETVFDKKLDAPYVVTTDALPLPFAWASKYELERSVPVAVGFDESFFAGSMQIFRHK